MTPNQPIPADPCQTLEKLICVELSPSKENGADAQVIEGESGAWQPVSLSAEVGGWHIQPWRVFRSSAEYPHGNLAGAHHGARMFTFQRRT